jgi:hypothetical protein
MPIERAVPLMLLIAASIEAAFKSGIFWVAISRTCFSVTRAHLGLVGHTGTLGQVRGLLQQHRRRRRLGDEGEAAVDVDSDDDGDGEAGHLLGLRCGR